jgi:Zn-dependent alcohol dehydrogenase
VVVLDEFVSHRFPLDEFNEGIASVRDGRVTCAAVELAPK